MDAWSNNDEYKRLCRRTVLDELNKFHSRWHIQNNVYLVYLVMTVYSIQINLFYWSIYYIINLFCGWRTKFEMIKYRTTDIAEFQNYEY